MNAHFDHERLDVYRDAIGFVSWADELLAEIPKPPPAASMRNHLSTARDLQSKR